MMTCIRCIYLSCLLIIVASYQDRGTPDRNRRDNTKLMDMIDNSPQFIEPECVLHVQRTDSEEISKHSFKAALQRSWFACADTMIKHANKALLPTLRSEYDMQTRLIQKDLTLLKTAFDLVAPTIVVAPAYQW